MINKIERLLSVGSIYEFDSGGIGRHEVHLPGYHTYNKLGGGGGGGGGVGKREIQVHRVHGVHGLGIK